MIYKKKMEPKHFEVLNKVWQTLQENWALWKQMAPDRFNALLLFSVQHDRNN